MAADGDYLVALRSDPAEGSLVECEGEQAVVILRQSDKFTASSPAT